MKKEASENIVRVKGAPKLTKAQLENLKRLAERPDDEIDYSDIQEITDFSGFKVGKSAEKHYSRDDATTQRKTKSIRSA